MEWYYVWWPWLNSKRVARVCQHQLSFLFWKLLYQCVTEKGKHQHINSIHKLLHCQSISTYFSYIIIIYFNIVIFYCVAHNNIYLHQAVSEFVCWQAYTNYTYWFHKTQGKGSTWAMAETIGSRYFGVIVRVTVRWGQCHTVGKDTKVTWHFL